MAAVVSLANSVKKGQTRFDVFDKILSLYTRGMSVRGIQAQLQTCTELRCRWFDLHLQRHRCSGEGTPTLAEPQFESVYPIVYFDIVSSPA